AGNSDPRVRAWLPVSVNNIDCIQPPCTCASGLWYWPLQHWTSAWRANRRSGIANFDRTSAGCQSRCSECRPLPRFAGACRPYRRKCVLAHQPRNGSGIRRDCGTRTAGPFSWEPRDRYRLQHRFQCCGTAFCSSRTDHYCIKDHACSNGQESRRRSNTMKISHNGSLRFFAIMMSAALVSCTVGPDYQPPSLEVSEVWINPVEPGSVDAAWWQRFNDPLLSRLVERAISGNRDIAAAAARLREASALRDAVQGRELPQAGASATASQSRLSENGQLPVGKVSG